MKKMETDIIVAAAGLSGLAAAISAAENGARVLVFEKSGTTGGGHWYHEKSAGMFWLNLAHTPSYTARRIGFRCAWIPDEDIAI